jgi:uncharacterized membrane-anchored protein
VHALPATIRPEVTDVFSSALGVTFTAGAAVAAIALLAVFALPRALQPGASPMTAPATAPVAA